MAIEKEALNKLIVLRERKKFTNPEWKQRGLNPSDPAIIEAMTRLTNVCLDELLADVRSDAPEEQMKGTLIKGLERFNATYYDTEEKEFIGDEFYKIGQVVGINMGESLNYWMYGEM